MKEREISSTGWLDMGAAVICVKRIINRRGEDTAVVLLRPKRGARIAVNSEIEDSGTHLVGVVGRKARRRRA